MGESPQLAARRRQVVPVALAALLAVLALPALAPAATTRIVAPGSSHEGPTCTTALPCNYLWAIKNSSSGDVVQLESGEYDYDGSGNLSLAVHSGVTLQPAPGDATRPVIKQTVAFPKCNCPTMGLESGVLIQGLEIDQAVAGFSTGAGALSMPPNSLVERSILIGVKNGMYFYSSLAPTGGVRDTLVVGESGYAVEGLGGTMNLDNVTAVAGGAEASSAVALFSVSSFGKATTINATNTIARGQGYDAEARVEATGGLSTVNLHYSDARTATEHVVGSEGAINDTDHPTHGEPLFVSSSDFHEVLGSPTIDAGTIDAASGSVELDGFPRAFGAGQDIGAYELQVLPPPPGPHNTPLPGPAGVPAPQLGALRISSGRFRAAAKGATVARAHVATGAVITYTDSQAASTTFTVQRSVAGVRKGHACVSPPRAHRHGPRLRPCARLVTVGTFAHSDVAGPNRLRFSGRLHARRLAPGAYRLSAVPRNSAGESGAPALAVFKIIA